VVVAPAMVVVVVVVASLVMGRTVDGRG
jgi:hypothetical protein